MQGCTNREIGGELKISPRTVKQHLRLLFLRAGILNGRKRVKLARYVREGESAVMAPCESLNPRENQISLLVWKGLTNREIGEIVGTSEQVVKNHLRTTFDKLGVWSRLELAMYVANRGGKDAYPGPSAAIPWETESISLIPDLVSGLSVVQNPVKERIVNLRDKLAQISEANCMARKKPARRSRGTRTLASKIAAKLPIYRGCAV